MLDEAQWRDVICRRYCGGAAKAGFTSRVATEIHETREHKVHTGPLTTCVLTASQTYRLPTEFPFSSLVIVSNLNPNTRLFIFCLFFTHYIPRKVRFTATR